MPALTPGEVSDPQNPKLDVMMRDQTGALVNVAECFFQVYEKVSDPGVPKQVYPSSGRKSVNLTDAPVGDRVATGQYVARWQVPQDAIIGTYQIKWTSRYLATSPEQTYTEEFEVLPAATLQANDLYISVEDIRALGLNREPPSDAQIQESIRYWQAIIERTTRQWFRPVATEFYLDGSGTDTISLPAPIISIDQVRINGLEDPLDKGRWRAYAGRAIPDDRRNPRIRLIDHFGYERDIFTAPDRQHRSVFFTGRGNQYVKGVFGYVEPDGSTPLPIQRALKKLVLRDLASPLVPIPGGSVLTPPPLTTGLVQTEWTDGHQITYATGMVKPRAPGLMGLIDDPEVQVILKLYKGPIALAAPSHPSWM